MITFGKSYIYNGQAYANLDDAKREALGKLLQVATVEVLNAILTNSSKVVDVLTITTSSKPMARKSNGGTKKRTPKAPEAPPAEADPDLGLQGASKGVPAANRPF